MSSFPPVGAEENTDPHQILRYCVMSHLVMSDHRQ